jgi:tetratricopeptide (TPR) repeat protein
MKAFHLILTAALAAALLPDCATAPARSPTAPAATNSHQPAPPAGVPLSRLGRGNPDAFAHFAAGISHTLNDEDAPALQQFTAAALADPANEPLVMSVAQQLLQNKDVDKALALLSSSARRPDASAALLSLLARAQLQANRPAQALASGKLATRRQPDALDGYQCQVEILLHDKHGSAALAVLGRAARRVRAEPGLLVALADLYGAYLKSQPNDAGAKAKAIAMLDRAAQLKFTSVSLWQRVADDYARLDQEKKAAAIYLRLLDQFPEASLTRDTLHEKLVGLYVQAEDRTNAMKQLQAILRDNPTTSPRAWFVLGELACENGSLSDAAADFRNALHWDPTIEQAYYDLALVLLDLHQSKEAFDTLEQARGLFHRSFACEFYAGVADAHINVKNYSDAIRHFKEAEVIALATNPSRLDQRFYFQFGAACERAGQFKQAEEYLQKCVDRAPDFAEALNYLGYMLADRGLQLPRARALIEKAVNLDPKNGAYLDSLGWVLFKLNRPRQALPWLLKAMQYTPEPDATVLDHLGEVYLALRQTDKALAAWRKSLSIEANDEIKRKLALHSGGSL